MKLHDIHIDYVLNQPFLAEHNDLETLFENLDLFSPVERIRMLDLTCSMVGIHVDIPYWTDNDYCQEIYDEFKTRTKRMAGAYGDFLLTFALVQTTLICLYDRSNPAKPKQSRKARIAAAVKHIESRVKAGLLHRNTAKALIRNIDPDSPGSYDSCGARYVQFCEQVVEHLL